VTRLVMDTTQPHLGVRPRDAASADVFTALAEGVAPRVAVASGGRRSFHRGGSGAECLMNLLAQAMKYFIFERSSWPPSC
jgi:hypothetical protein